VIEKAGDLAGILTKLKNGEVLFIDEIHRMPRQIEEYLYSAMEDFSLDLIVDSGASSRSVKVKLNRFTLVGATTRPGLLSSPLRSRFAMTWQLDHYVPEVLQEILVRTSERLKVAADRESLYEIARRSRGTPRIANNLLRWVRDFAQMRAGNVVSREVVRQALAMRSIDERGLEEMDMRLLKVIIDDYQGGPVGLSTLAVALGEEPDTLQEVYEPFLIMQGLLKRTPRGRRATARAYELFGRELPTEGGTT